MKTSPFSILFVFILLSAVYAPRALAQDTLKRSFSINLGGTHYRFIDQAFAHERIKYKGNAFVFQLGYSRSTPAHYISASFSAGVGSVSSAFRRPSANVTFLQFAAAYGRTLSEYRIFQYTTALSAGVRLSSDNYFLENLDEFDEGTLTANHTVGAIFVQQTRISGRVSVVLSLALPVAGFTKRTSYDGGINQQLEEDFERNVFYPLFHHAGFRFINPFELPALSLDFNRRIGSKTDLIIGYRFVYLKDESIAPVQLYGNTLNIGFKFKFDKEL